MGIEIDLELSDVFSGHLPGERTGEVIFYNRRDRMRGGGTRSKEGAFLSSLW